MFLLSLEFYKWLSENGFLQYDCVFCQIGLLDSAVRSLYVFVACFKRNKIIWCREYNIREYL